MKLEQFATAVRHRITGGSEYQWQCYGDQARWLDAGWEKDGDQWQASVVFDGGTQRVYECQVSDYRTEQAWIWRDPEFGEAHDREAAERGVDPRFAWDAVPWQVVGGEQEIIQRIQVIADPRERVDIELPDDEILKLCLRAHELDMTLNDFIGMILREFIERNHPEVLAPQEATMTPAKRSNRRKDKKQ